MHSLSCFVNYNYPACAYASRSYVIGAGVHLHMYLYKYKCTYMTPPKSLSGTLVVDSPFQTLAVDFSLNL